MFAKAIRDIKRHKISYAFIAPFYLLFIVFTTVPVVVSMALSFFYYNVLEPPRFVGWDNYIRLFLQDDIFMIGIKNTLMFAAITGPISYVACFSLAWMINELSPKIRAFLTFIFYVPSLTGSVFTIWQLVFSSDAYGYANAYLLKLGLIDDPILWLQTPQYIMPIIIGVALWLSLGTAFLAFIAGFQTIDRSLYEAGAIDGIKNRWQELWFITLPSMKPMLLFGAVMQITSSFASAGSIADAMAGFPSVNYAAHTVTSHMNDHGLIRFDMGYAAAISVLLFAVMIGTNKAVNKMLQKVGT